MMTMIKKFLVALCLVLGFIIFYHDTNGQVSTFHCIDIKIQKGISCYDSKGEVVFWVPVSRVIKVVRS
jgi:hypothetical protein